MLSEDRRKQLDSIVGQMETNAEPEEAIRAVVEDFKGKYSGAAELTPSQKLGSEVGAATTGIAKGVGGRAVDAISGAVGMVAEPFLQPLRIIGKSAQGAVAELQGKPSEQYKLTWDEVIPAPARHARDSIGSYLRQAGEFGGLALEAAKEGNLGEAAGRVAQAGLSAFPLTSGAVLTGEKFAGDPSKRWEAIGEGIFDIFTTAPLPKIPGATRTVPRKLAERGSRMVKGAIESYAEGLYPKLRFEGLSEKVAKEALDRGLWARGLKDGGLGTLEDAASRLAAEHGPRIGEILRGADETLDVSALTEKPLREFGASETVGGQAQGVRDLAGAADEELARLPGNISLEEAWRLRRIKEDPTVRAGAYLPGADPALTARVQAQGIVADTIRPALEEIKPELAPHMQGYSFAKNLQTLLETRKKTPETSLNPFKAKNALELIDPYRIVRAIQNSPRWKTGSALVRYRIGKLLEAGNIPEAAKAAEVDLRPLNLPEDRVPDLETYQAPESPFSPAEPLAPSIWGDEAPSGFQSLPEPPMSALERAAEAEFLRPDLEAGINADQARLAREFRQNRNKSRDKRYDMEEEWWNSPEPPLGTSPERIQALNEASAREFSTLKEGDMSSLLKELEDIGYSPEPIPFEGLSQTQLKKLHAADRKAAQVALRTMKNPTYQKLPIAGKSNAKLKKDVIKAIFDRHRGRVLSGS